MSEIDLGQLKSKIDGELYTDNLHKILFATDASVYREIPLGVVFPKHVQDIKRIVEFCYANGISIIPRAGGTSLAGQCVGSGLVVDVSKHMVNIIELDTASKTATVQPGVIRDELNHVLKESKLMVGPNTSTANRAMIGGMVGNNSCGSTSIVFGSTRDHVKILKAVLSDGSEVVFEALTKTEFQEKCQLDSLEGKIYKELWNILKHEHIQKIVKEAFPKSSIKRRNTGYAIDALLDSEVFVGKGDKIDVCKLLCGSEGTLAFITEITIGLVDHPPDHEVMVAIQFDSVNESLRAVPHIMNHSPFACELMDKTVLDCTKGQIMYESDRYFLKGDPMAVLLVSFVHNEKSHARTKVEHLVSDLKEANYRFEHTVIEEGIDRIWNLRKAGLGLLANLPGDPKAVACIEDTAVAIEDLSTYIAEFTVMMEKYGQKSVYYGHAGAGEIHLRPILDIKLKEDRELFYNISLESAKLVKKYRGSLSGEHGDGRVRAPFIKEVYGDEIYEVFSKVKRTWDPKGIFNPGKIVDAKPIVSDLRFDENHVDREYETVFDFSQSGGVLKAAEKCNGSGDCRKLPFSGGTMCPSYMATRNEKDTTRARANTLREILTRPKSGNAWNSSELKEVMDLCLSCKGCTSECPSNVDMSSMKAEFLHQYQKINGITFRSRVFSRYESLSSLGSKASSVSNLVTGNNLFGRLFKKVLGIHPKRSIPKISKKTLRSRFSVLQKEYEQVEKRKSLYLFVDEFTNYNDANIGETAIRLLFGLGYDVKIIDHSESGRAAISKGVLDYAVECANSNVSIFYPIINNDVPLIGIEPSAILTFVDEYPRLVKSDLREQANQLAKNVFTIESFLYKEVKSGNLQEHLFTTAQRSILLHGHCHQKALTDFKEVAWILSLPKNYSVKIIPSGCCGMAGSFGYEKEHFDLSMQIGEMVLFPAVRSADSSTEIIASGTSCRHQILDGTGVQARHVVEVLFDALVK